MGHVMSGRSLVLSTGSLIATLVLAAAAPARPSGDNRASTGFYTFVSAPNLHPPKLDVLAREPGLAPGDFLAANSPAVIVGRGATAQGGPLIMDSHARPVWFLPTRGLCFDLQQETYRGKPVLLFFTGPDVVGPKGKPRRVGEGEVVVYDQHYRKIATIKAHSPWQTDLHDASILGGDIWITVTREVQHVNLTGYGGSRDGAVQDVGLQKFQISTGRLIRTWDALNPGGKANVPLSASERRPLHAWDAYHLNSVQALPDGDLLVSMRNTWTVYLIDPATGRIIWTLGGKHSSFKLGPGARFAWQHDARLVQPAQGAQGRNVELTLFNDDNDRYRNHPSEGMVLGLNTITHRAKLLHAYRHDPALYAVVLGSMQLLPNGNALVGWGSEPYFSEYSSSGRKLLDVEWSGFAQSYRTLFTDTWVATPYYAPSGAVRGDTVYASWNGATEVASWQVLAGAGTTGLAMVGSRSRTGFQTAIKLGQSYGVYEVRALAANGQVLGTSKTFS
jgi:hypothetical protein